MNSSEFRSALVAASFTLLLGSSFLIPWIMAVRISLDLSCSCSGSWNDQRSAVTSIMNSWLISSPCKCEILLSKDHDFLWPFPTHFYLGTKYPRVWSSKLNWNKLNPSTSSVPHPLPFCANGNGSVIYFPGHLDQLKYSFRTSGGQGPAPGHTTKESKPMSSAMALFQVCVSKQTPTW